MAQSHRVLPPMTFSMVLNEVQLNYIIWFIAQEKWHLSERLG